MYQNEKNLFSNTDSNVKNMALVNEILIKKEFETNVDQYNELVNVELCVLLYSYRNTIENWRI